VPSDTFSARARVAYSDDEFDQQATLYDRVNTIIRPPESYFALQTVSNQNIVVGLFGGSAGDMGSRRPVLTPDPVTGKAYDGGDLDNFNSSLKLDWDIGSGTITSYTGYVDADFQQVFDGDFDVRLNAAGDADIARGGTFIDFDTDTRLISQELRFASAFEGPVQFTVGALYWDEKVDQVETGISVLTFPFGGAPENLFNDVVPITTVIPNNVSRDTNSRSIFGVIEWELASSWKLTLEGRYAREKMDVSGTGCDPDQTLADFRCTFSTPDLATEFPPGSGMFAQLERVQTKDSSTSYYFAPRAIIEWTPAEDLLTYFSISQGIKPGGIATVASGTWMDQPPADGNLNELKFDDEKLTAYELGAKSTLLDRSLTLNGALFFQNYDDKQIPVQITNGFPFTSISNAGEAEVWGLELESTWLPTDNTRLQLGYTWLDAEYTALEYPTNSANSIARAGNCTPDATNRFCFIDLGDNSLEDVPRHSLIALAGWYPALGPLNLTGLLEADAEWQDERYIDEFNDRKIDSYTIVNMRVGVQTDAWDALVYVNNVFDNDTIQSWSAGTGLVATAERTDPNLTAFPGEGFAIAPPPRQWGVRANLRF
jgi:iron complex outermembrane receptor protein